MPETSKGPTHKPVEVTIKDKKMSLWAPDDYDESKVNTDPPQERLKLEWM